MSEDMPHRMPDRWTWSFLRTSIAERLAMVYPNLSWSALLYPNMSWSAWWPIRVGLVSLLYPNMSWSAWWPILGVRSWCPILEIRWPILEIRWPILSSRFGCPGDRSWWPIRTPPIFTHVTTMGFVNEYIYTHIFKICIGTSDVTVSDAQSVSTCTDGKLHFACVVRCFRPAKRPWLGDMSAPC